MSVWALQPPLWWPLLLLLPVALAVGYWWAQRHHSQIRNELGRREENLCGVRCFTRVRPLLSVLAVMAVGVALLRPVSPGREAQLAPDVVLCVDVSRSMAAGDGDPTRFASMQQQVHRLLAAGIGSRFGLLAFAGDVRVVAPLTGDREAVSWLLGELSPGAIGSSGAGRGGTDIGAAIEVAVGSLQRVGSLGEVVLLTDGEDFAGTAAQAAARAVAAGHRVHCIGYGSSAGSKIVIEQDGEQIFLQDGTGDDVITRLDVESLTAVAGAGAGTFATAAGPDALFDLWRDELVPFTANRRLAAGEEDVVPRFGWPLLAGLLLLMLRMCLPERRR